MKYFYEYEDSMRQCETLLEKNFSKLRKYEKCQDESFLLKRTKRNDVYIIVKKKLDAVQENISSLKSEYHSLTRLNFNLSLFQCNFTEKYFKYLVRQEALRLKFIEIIDECKRINASLDDILKDCSVEVSNEQYCNRNQSNCFDATSDHSNAVSGFDLWLSVPKLEWDEFETSSFLNELAKDLVSSEQSNSTKLCTSPTDNVSKSVDFSSPDLKDNPAVKKYYSTKVLGAEPVNVSASSERNVASNLGRSFSCNICSRNFANGSNLRRHTRILHKGLKPFKCPECHKSFSREDWMKSHVLLTHVQLQNRSKSRLESNICEKYSSRSDLNSHEGSVKLEHASIATPAPKLFEYSPTFLGTNAINKIGSANRDKAANLGQAIVCGICGRNFKSKHHLNRHTFLHVGLKPFECAECGRSFSQKETMEEHARLLHNPYHTRQYKCDNCDRRFTSQSRLNVHKRLARHLSAFELPFSSLDMHGGITVNKCHLAIFSSTRKVNESMPWNRNIPPNSSQCAVCDICGRIFSRPHDMRKHKFLHSGLKPFKCGECGKSFARREYVKKHVLLTHVPHQLTLDSLNYCAHCNYRSKLIENLAYHIKREHIPDLNLEDFSCTQCGRIFERNGARRRHEKNFHAKGNFYCCTSCGMRYKYSRSLARHLERKQCSFEEGVF
ncbi:zinc finger protein 184-like [Planococcus citri]|uniref:zinc finger protein 184-like n=1 Tax=Planococcus citri TaxID=170843 RepID=UPI0031F7AA55